MMTDTHAPQGATKQADRPRLFLYLRDNVKGVSPWSQSSAMYNVNPNWDKISYVDNSEKPARRTLKADPACEKVARRLVRRAEMLADIQAAGGGEIVVTSLCCLAISSLDLVYIMDTARTINAVVRSLADNALFDPASPMGIHKALAAWRHEHGERATASARNAKTYRRDLDEKRRSAALAIARPLWGQPSSIVKTKDIMEKAGMSAPTLILHLGPRRQAQKRESVLRNCNDQQPRQAQ